MEDVLKQLHHFGDVQFLDLRCDTFQISFDGPDTMSAAFILDILLILDAVFQKLDSLFKLFDLLFVLLFFCA